MLNKIKHSKKAAVILIIVLVIICIAGICVSAAINNGKEEGFALVGDGYIVQVTQKQFDEFGTGEFAGGGLEDLEKFIERYNLVKKYPE